MAFLVAVRDLLQTSCPDSLETHHPPCVKNTIKCYHTKNKGDNFFIPFNFTGISKSQKRNPCVGPKAYFMQFHGSKNYLNCKRSET